MQRRRVRPRRRGTQTLGGLWRDHVVAKTGGKGLNNLFVQCFVSVVRPIEYRSGRGVVCFVSNYACLDGLSLGGTRDRYGKTFDSIGIDCVNGDKY